MSHEENKNKGEHFRIHIQEDRKNIDNPEDHPNKKILERLDPERYSKSESKPEPEEKKTIKTVLKDGGRQIAASALILLVGFFLLNWSAYTQIAKSKIDELLGKEKITFEEIDKNQNGDSSILKPSNDPDLQKKRIPQLAMEITPSDNRLIIPRINQNIPIVRVSSQNLIDRDWNALENDIQDALQDGVVHYPGTALPGKNGNTVITGHSSYFPWDPGRFKDVFALLHQVVVGDKLVVYYNQERFDYQVTDIKVVLPDQIEVLKSSKDEQLTLITCTPVGTNLKRLVVIAKPIKDSPVDQV